MEIGQPKWFNPEAIDSGLPHVIDANVIEAVQVKEVHGNGETIAEEMRGEK